MSEYDRVLREHVALVTAAADFAARCHNGQARKGAPREPFLNHLAEVASLLASSLDEPDAFLVAAGWLHDTIEKAGATREQIEADFGRFVVDIVVEVTDDQSLPEAQRRRLQVVDTPHKSPEARLLKLADKTSNLRALAAGDASDWPLDDGLAYVEWAEAVAASCQGLNEKLDAAFNAAVENARTAISERSREAARA